VTCHPAGLGGQFYLYEAVVSAALTAKRDTPLVRDHLTFFCVIAVCWAVFNDLNAHVTLELCSVFTYRILLACR
jgi:hypothetical protein